MSLTIRSFVQSAALGLGLVTATGAMAQDTCADVPAVLSVSSSADQIRCALTSSRKSSMSRSISIVSSDEQELSPTRFAITFEFGSAALTKDSKALLEKVAEVIAKDEALKASAFFIDGHTDAVGSSKANEKLGLDRAQSAASFLLAQAETPLAFKVRSFGETRLFDPDAPNSEINRRVEITPVKAE